MASLVLSTPVTYLIVQKCLISLLIAFSPQGSILRPMILPFLVLCNYYLLPTYVSYFSRPPWRCIVSGEILAGLLGSVEKLLLSQWNFESYGPGLSAGKADKAEKEEVQVLLPGKKINSGREIWQRLKFGTWVTTSGRYIGSPYQVRNVPPYSKHDPSYVPTRFAFLRNWSIRFIVSYLVLDLLAQGSQPEKNPINYAEGHVPLFSRVTEVTREELMTRTVTSVFWWVGSYLAIQVYYTGLALLSVSSGIDRPELWRPICGPLGEAYTIRGFWSVFWHQFMRKRLTKLARYITFHIFGLPRGESVDSPFRKLLARYTELFFVFFISGLLHHTIDVAQGMAWTGSGATTFFVMMAIGIMMEDCTQWVIYDVLMNGGKRGQLWAKAVGYIWVLLAFTYATPFWAYPTLRKNTGGTKNQVLPFSVLAKLEARK